jgi:hypothetical protein
MVYTQNTIHFAAVSIFPTSSYGSFEYIQAARRDYILPQHAQYIEHTTHHAQDKSQHPRPRQNHNCKTSRTMFTYTTTDIAAEAVINIKLWPTSQTAATFIPATQHTAAQAPPSPSATKIASDATAAERPLSLSPKAPVFVPATKTPKSPLSPHAAVCVPRTPVERLPLMPEPLPAPRSLLALLEHCRRKIFQRIEVLERLEQLPSYLGRKSGQELLESVFSCDAFEAACDPIGMELVDLIARYKAIKAQLDAPI